MYSRRARENYSVTKLVALMNRAVQKADIKVPQNMGDPVHHQGGGTDFACTYYRDYFPLTCMIELCDMEGHALNVSPTMVPQYVYLTVSTTDTGKKFVLHPRFPKPTSKTVKLYAYTLIDVQKKITELVREIWLPAVEAVPFVVQEDQTLTGISWNCGRMEEGIAKLRFLISAKGVSKEDIGSTLSFLKRTISEMEDTLSNI